MAKVDAMKQGVREEGERMLSELQGLGGKIRLKMHLAGAESRDAWNKLEPEIGRFEQRVERATEAALEELRAAGKELRSSLEKLYKDLARR